MQWIAETRNDDATDSLEIEFWSSDSLRRGSQDNDVASYHPEKVVRLKPNAHLNGLLSFPGASNVNKQVVEYPTVDRVALESRGWAWSSMCQASESVFCEQLLAVAATLGTPVATRAGGDLCDVLIPTVTEFAKPRSLSKLHSVDDFPLHNDTAHWPIPCRYVILACISPGSGARPTVLLDARRSSLSEQEFRLLQTTPLRVVNGRNSFFSSILSAKRPFVRYDQGCMKAASVDEARALEVFSQNNWLEQIETIQWQKGKLLVLDNWRVLHGRGHSNSADFDRKLLRISVI